MEVTTPLIKSAVNDSTSYAESVLTASTGSTVWGPGALTGKALKAIGNTSLDLLCTIMIRRRLAFIRQMLKKSPRILTNPATPEEWQQMKEICISLKELCRDYYSQSHRQTAATLIKEVAQMTAPAPLPWFIDAAPTHSQWEALFNHVQCCDSLSAEQQGLSSVVTICMNHFRQSGQLIDLEKAVLSYERVVKLRSTGRLDRWSLFNGLASAILTQFKESENSLDLDQVVLLFEQCIQLHPQGHPDSASSLSELAFTLETRFKKSGQPGDLDKAISLYEQVLALRPSDHHSHSISLKSLTNAILTRFTQSGQHIDLEIAVELLEAMIVHCSLDHPDCALLFQKLALTVDAQSQKSNKLTTTSAIVLYDIAKLGNLRPAFG